MLVASAAASLIAPITAQASDVMNLEGMNDYSGSKSSARIDSKTFINEVSEDIATLKGRVDGLEARQNNLEAGSFSDTTTLDGKAVFTVGGVEYSEDKTQSDLSESVSAAYMYQLNLNTSFNGDDNLYVRLKAGNHDGNAANGKAWSVDKTFGGYLSAGNTNSDAVKVDKIWYTLPVDDQNTVYVGGKIENYYMHGTTPSIYQPVTKQFTLGGNGEAYGASTDSGIGWAYRGDNGFALSSNIVTKGNGSTSGVLTNQSKTSWATQVGMTKEQYSVSAIVNVKANGWGDGYYEAGDASGTSDGSATHGNYTSIGLRAWWRPEDSGSATPSVSLGYDTTSYDGSTAATDNATAWFAGLSWNDLFQADDKVGIAFGQPTTNESTTTDPFAYELYYSFKPNDSIEITPAVFGGSDRNGTAGDDIFGAVLQTTFKF